MDGVKLMKLYEKIIIPVLIIMLLIIIPTIVILGMNMINYEINGYLFFSSMTEINDLLLDTIISFLPFIVVILFALSLAYVVYQIID